MSDVATETKHRKEVQRRSVCDEHRARDGKQRPGARGLSEAARKRRAQGQAAERNRRGDQDLQHGRRILDVGQGPRRRSAAEDGQGLSRPLGFCGAPHGRRGRQARDRGLPARQAFSGSGVEVEPVLRLREAALSADERVGAGPREKCRGARPAHPQEGRVLRAADHQRDRAVEFRADQSGSAARRRWPRTATIWCAA